MTHEVAGRTVAALGRADGPEVWLFNPENGEVATPEVTGASIVWVAWLETWMVAGIESPAVARTVSVEAEAKTIGRCSIEEKMWMTGPVELEIGQHLVMRWLDVTGNVVMTLVMPPVDAEMLQPPQWYRYGPEI